jgi:8-oxo-dGTP diphosphatase
VTGSRSAGPRAGDGESDVPAGESDVPVGESDVPVGESDVPVGEFDVRFGEPDIRGGGSGVLAASPTSGSVSPPPRLGEPGTRVGESGIRLGEPETRVGESAIRLGESDVRGGESDVRVGAPVRRVRGSTVGATAGRGSHRRWGAVPPSASTSPSRVAGGRAVRPGASRGDRRHAPCRARSGSIVGVALQRSTLMIDAPPRAVAGLVRDADLAAEALRRAGHRLTGDARLLVAGAQVRLATRVLPGVRVPVRTVIGSVSPAGMTSKLVSGPVRAVHHDVRLRPFAAATLVVDEIRWTTPLGPLGRLADALLLRRVVRRLLAARAEVLAERAADLAAAPVVVATALVRDGRVLAAQRTRPAELAGRWELPGGRVEPGESEPDAVVRECREELGTEVRTTGRLGTDLPIPAGVLRVHAAVLDGGAPEPRALEHAALRWVGPDELGAVEWVDADRAVLDDLRDLLRAGAPVR